MSYAVVCMCSSRHHLIPACCGAAVVSYTLSACVIGIIVVNSNVSRYGDIRGVLSMHPSPWSTLSGHAFPILALSIVFPSLLVLFAACLQQTCVLCLALRSSAEALFNAFSICAMTLFCAHCHVLHMCACACVGLCDCVVIVWGCEMSVTQPYCQWLSW